MANVWLFPVAPDHWEIVKSRNIWAVRTESTREKLRPQDSILFYLKGSIPHVFVGAFRIVGDWIRAQTPIWTEEIPKNQIRYPWQFKLDPIQLGATEFTALVPQLSFVTSKHNWQPFLMGSPANFGRPIPAGDLELVVGFLQRSPIAYEIKQAEVTEETGFEGFTERDYSACTGKIADARYLSSRFQSLREVLLPRLAPPLSDFKHYVAKWFKMVHRGQEPRDHMWIGLAHQKYDDPHQGIQLQVSLSRTDPLSIEIWLDRKAANARKEAKANILKDPSRFLALLKSLRGFEFGLSGAQDFQDKTESATDTGLQNFLRWLARREVHGYVSLRLAKEEVLTQGPDIVDTIADTFQKLLPVYTFLIDQQDVTSVQLGTYLLLRSQPKSVWQDVEGREYHFGANVPNYKAIVPGAAFLIDRRLPEGKKIIAKGKIASVLEEKVKGPSRTFRAQFEGYTPLRPPKSITPQLEQVLQMSPGYNAQHSVRVLSKDAFDMLSRPTGRTWSDLTPVEIDEITKEVLSLEGQPLAIEEAVVKRIIQHLVVGKHAILIGPPGTGKTDLARRLLRAFSKRLLLKDQFHEAVASYEWGRYEVIGGNSIETAGVDRFHLGCVSASIKEDEFLLIDEFNRADMNKAFGEMFMAIDHGKIALREDEQPHWLRQDEKSAEAIFIPQHWRMICTMNDYDKSLLSELSYGLLRRFAYVEIDTPRDMTVEKGIVIQRVRKSLREGAKVSDEALDAATQKVILVIDRFFDFLFKVREVRKMGVSTSIDVVQYIVLGLTALARDDPWTLLNEALIDYLLPQLDRLDLEVVRTVHSASEQSFTVDGQQVQQLQDFNERLDGMIRKLEDLDKLFATG